MYFVFKVASKIYFSTDFSQMILWIALWVLNVPCAAPKSLRKMHLIFVTSHTEFCIIEHIYAVPF